MVTKTKTNHTQTGAATAVDRDQLTKQANQLLQEDDLAAAYPLLRNLSEQADATAQTCVTAGLVGLTLGKVDEARQSFEHALTIAPDDFDSRYNLFLLEMLQNAPDKALERLNQLIELYPDNANLYNDRAVLAMDRENSSEVLKDLTTAIQLEPNSRKPIECGLAYFMQKGLATEGSQLVASIKKNKSANARTVELLEQWSKKFNPDR